VLEWLPLPTDMAVAAQSSVGYLELFAFGIMLVAFLLATLLARLPVGLALAISAVAGAIAGGYLFPVDDLIRHLIDGSFGYLDPILKIATVTIFMFVIEANGLLGTLTHQILVTFRKRPVLLLAGCSILIMLPGAFTGSSTACVLTTGAMLAPVLMRLGIPRTKVGAILAMNAVFGMVAPPVNIPALIIAAGVDMPYIGLELPLLLLTVPPALITTWALGLPHLRSGAPSDVLEDLPPSLHARHGLKLYLPLVLSIVMMVGERYIHGPLHPGQPLIFLVCALLGCVTGERVRLWSVSIRALESSMPILGILLGVGMFIQVMTLVGARGELVIQAMQVPRGWTGLYPLIGLSLPAFGAVSSFGAASVLGVPFTLALGTASQVIILNVAVLSLLAGLGDLMPPTAKASIFAGQVVGEPNYMRLLKYCVLPAFLTILICLLVLQFGDKIAPFVVRI
jgi:GntP family gluconate:H+ symporter